MLPALIRALPALVGALVWCPGVASAILDVHIIAHTHDDVGWLKTVDEYYVGANSSIQQAGVRYILDSVVAALQVNSARRFSYVEVAFFSRWWSEQTNATKNVVAALVRNGQLEFLNGGWCMNDEGTTTLTDTINQMASGLIFIQENFGVRPRVAWQIDPFGHSSTFATAAATLGMDALVVGRIDYQDKEHRFASKTMEMVCTCMPQVPPARIHRAMVPA